MYINKAMHITVLHINYLCLHFRTTFKASTSGRLRQKKESNLVTPAWQKKKKAHTTHTIWKKNIF